MANTIIVYYSLEGNVNFLARALASECGADVFRLETVKDYPKKGLMKFLHGGHDATIGYKPELKKKPDISAYSRVVLGTPVWAGKMSAPLASFIDAADFSGKEVFSIISSAGGPTKKCAGQIAAEVQKKGGAVKAVESFVNPLRRGEEALEKIKAFAKNL